MDSQGAGTGGTSATIGRYIRYKCKDTQLCVVDPSHSVFFDYYAQRDQTITISRPSQIEGIGRPRVEPSFIPHIVDHLIRVPDAASLATIHFLEQVVGRRCGGSTGTNVYGSFQLIAEMLARGERGSVVTLICDSGERYADTYYSTRWLAEQGYELAPYSEQLRRFFQSGKWVLPH